MSAKLHGQSLSFLNGECAGLADTVFLNASLMHRIPYTYNMQTNSVRFQTPGDRSALAINFISMCPSQPNHQLTAEGYKITVKNSMRDLKASDKF